MSEVIAASALTKVGRSWRRVRVLDCPDCGEKFSTVWDRQIVCSPCGVARRSNVSSAAGRAKTEVRSEALAEIASSAGRQETRLSDVLRQPEFAWSVMFSLPFSLNVSKNRRWSNNGRGGKFLSQGVRDYQDQIIAATSEALKGVSVKQNKLWVSFFVEKPNNRIDAVNVVDTLCDAIKVAAGLDDRWFCIGLIDWAIKKNDPAIIIKISQEADHDVMCCSYCGELKALEHFTNRANRPLGKDRVCRPCRAVVQAAASKRRRA